MDYAIQFAETGHLCLATLHANSANQALDRIINFFPEEKRSQLLMDLALNLKAIISQRLIVMKDGKGRVPAVELMINSPLISDLIMKVDVPGVKEIMAKSGEAGMQTFDQSLFTLYEAGLISYDDALRKADSQNDVRLRIKLEGKDANASQLGESMRNVTLKIPRLPTPRGRQVYLTREQVQAVAAACPDPRVRDAILIAAWSGLRLGEITRLTACDVGDGCLLVRESKSDRPRSVPVAAAIAEAVARLPLGLGHRAIQAGWTRAREAAGLPGARFHDLRHTSASWLIQSGVELYTVGTLLGHGSAQTTRRYAHLDTGHLKRAMARLD